MREAVIFIFGGILRVTLGIWLKIVYNIKGFNEEVKNMPGPFLLVGNHCLNWDPFMTGLYLKPNTRFIASDSLFRDKAIAWLLTNLVGAIPKKKAVSDLKTIKLSIKELKKGNVVGVYPEANRTWNGRTIDILYSTAKFVKLMKVPVVNCIIKGGYLSRPRWSVRGRRGRLELHYEVLFTQDDVKQKSVDEIYEKMNNAIQYNEFDWQAENMIPYKSRSQAEYLENYLYICPKCMQIGTLNSHKDDITCSVCGLKYTMGDYGYFVNDDRKFENPMEWGDWQAEHFKKLCVLDDLIYKDHVELFGEDEKNNLYKVDEGELSLYNNRLVFKSSKLTRTFFISEIFGNTIQLNYIFDFYYKGDFVRLKCLPKNRASVFKWNFAVDYLKEEFSRQHI